MVALAKHRAGVESVPPPDAVRREMIALVRQLRLTKHLLRLSERVHAPRPSGAVPESQPREAAHVG